jgi:hypothetical protein
MLPSERPAVAAKETLPLPQETFLSSHVEHRDDQLAAGYRATAEAMTRQNAELEQVIVESLTESLKR